MDTSLSDMGLNSLPESQPEAAPENTPHDLRIDVLGASFSITAGADSSYLNEVLAQYKIAIANTQGISGVKDPLKVAILTGFLLCDEINKMKSHAKEEQAAVETRIADDMGEVNRITQRLIECIDRVFEETE